MSENERSEIPRKRPNKEELRKRAARNEGIKRRTRLDELIIQEAVSRGIDISLEEVRRRLDPGLRGMLALIDDNEQ